MEVWDDGHPSPQEQQRDKSHELGRPSLMMSIAFAVAIIAALALAVVNATYGS